MILLPNACKRCGEPHLHLMDPERQITKAAALIQKATADDVLRTKFEQSMVRQLGKEWKKVAEKAVKAGVAQWDGKQTRRQVAEIVAAVQKEVDKFGKSLPVIDQQVGDLYVDLAEQFIRKHRLQVSKAVGTGRGARFEVSLTQKDEDAIDALNRLNRVSAGTLFPEEVMDKVAESVADTILDEGLDPSEAATLIEEQLMGALGLDIEGVIPAQFHTNPVAYFEILATNVSQLATNVGRVISMDDAGVEVYRIVAVIDELTSDICLDMNDRLISTGAGMRMVNQFLEFDGPNELKEMFPWDSSRSGLGPNTLENNDKLVEEGLGFPPYHGSCRTTVVPEFVR